jgi:hypothetical protein
MDKQLAQHRTQEQGSRIAAAAHLNYEFAMYTRQKAFQPPKCFISAAPGKDAKQSFGVHLAPSDTLLPRTPFGRGLWPSETSLSEKPRDDWNSDARSQLLGVGEKRN